MKKLRNNLMLILTLCLIVFTLTACSKDDACKHKNKETEMLSQATCEQTGLEKITCKDCGEFIEEKVVPKANCIAGGWETTSSSSCTRKGSKRKSCVNCGRVLDVKEISLLDHSYDDGICASCGKINPKYTDGLVFTLMANNEFCVSDYNNEKYVYLDVIIPSTYAGKPVTSIGDGAFKNCSGLKSVRIPDGVKYIGNEAFYGCRLESVEIPKSVTTIGNSAFEDTWLINLVISDGVTTIGNNAFSSISSLNKVIIPKSVMAISHNAFSECTSLTIYCEAESKPNGWENTWNRIDSYNIGNTTTIPVVWGCVDVVQEDNINYLLLNDGSALLFNATYKKMTTVNIKSNIVYNGTNYNVTKINEKAFNGFELLESVSIPNSIIEIGNNAFYWCGSLKSLTIPNSVITLGSNAFAGCSSLANVSIGNGLTNISDRVFSGCKSLVNITIPSSVNRIGVDAFSGCSSLTSIFFEDTSNWYRTNSSSGGGTITDVSKPSTNVVYLTSIYSGYVWYKN